MKRTLSFFLFISVFATTFCVKNGKSTEAVTKKRGSATAGAVVIHPDRQAKFAAKNNHMGTLRLALATKRVEKPPFEDVQTLEAAQACVDAALHPLSNGEQNRCALRLLRTNKMPILFLYVQHGIIAQQRVERLPVKPLYKKIALAGTMPDFPSDSCNVCLKEFLEGNNHRILCGHHFHKECITPWLRAHTTCPSCKQEVR